MHHSGSYCRCAGFVEVACLPAKHSSERHLARTHSQTLARLNCTVTYQFILQSVIIIPSQPKTRKHQFSLSCSCVSVLLCGVGLGWRGASLCIWVKTTFPVPATSVYILSASPSPNHPPSTGTRVPSWGKDKTTLRPNYSQLDWLLRRISRQQLFQQQPAASLLLLPIKAPGL